MPSVQPEDRPTLTSLLTPAAAEVVALRCSLLKLLDPLSHGHVDGLLLCRLLLAARRQVERFGHGGATVRSGLRWRSRGKLLRLHVTTAMAQRSRGQTLTGDAGLRS